MNYPGETLMTTDAWSGSVFSGRESETGGRAMGGRGQKTGTWLS